MASMFLVLSPTHLLSSSAQLTTYVHVCVCVCVSGMCVCVCVCVWWVHRLSSMCEDIRDGMEVVAWVTC